MSTPTFIHPIFTLSPLTHTHPGLTKGGKRAMLSLTRPKALKIARKRGKKGGKEGKNAGHHQENIQFTRGTSGKQGK